MNYCDFSQNHPTKLPQSKTFQRQWEVALDALKAMKGDTIDTISGAGLVRSSLLSRVCWGLDEESHLVFEMFEH